jgi:hypothetical protein
MPGLRQHAAVAAGTTAAGILLVSIVLLVVPGAGPWLSLMAVIVVLGTLAGWATETQFSKPPEGGVVARQHFVEGQSAAHAHGRPRFAADQPVDRDAVRWWA